MNYEESLRVTEMEQHINLMEMALRSIIKETNQNGCVTANINATALQGLYAQVDRDKPKGSWDDVAKAIESTIGDVDERTKRTVIGAAILAAKSVRHNEFEKLRIRCSETAEKISGGFLNFKHDNFKS